MRRLPRRIVQQIGKIFVIWFLMSMFSLVGLLSLQIEAYAYTRQQSVVLDMTSTSDTATSEKTSDSETATSEKTSVADDPTPTSDDPTPTPDDPTPTPTKEPTPTPTPTPKPTATPTPKPTATPTPKPTATPTPKLAATATPKPVATPTRPTVPATPVTNGGGVLPTPTAPDATPTEDQPTPEATTAPPPQTTPPDNPVPTPTPKTATTPHDQGTMTTLIVTGSLGMTTLVSAGVLIGMQQRKKKLAGAMAYSQMQRPSQTEFELAVQASAPQQAFAPQQAYTPHLMDPNLLNSPIVNDILQQGPDMFMANGAAPANMQAQFDPFAAGMPAQFDPFAAGMQAQNAFPPPSEAVFEQSTALMPNYPQNDPGAASAFYTQPMMTSAQNVAGVPDMPQNNPASASMFYTEPMMTSAQNGMDVPGSPQNGPMGANLSPATPVPPPSIEPGIRTDPRVIAMQKQAQMGIFVLPGQDKQEGTESESL